MNGQIVRVDNPKFRMWQGGGILLATVAIVAFVGVGYGIAFLLGSFVGGLGPRQK